MLIGYCLTGSFCTINQSLNIIETLVERGDEVLPVVSENVRNHDTRFNKAADILTKLKNVTGKEPLTTITESEMLGPVIKCDVMVVAPCTSNTLAKLARGITDNTVTLAVKAHLRNQRPVVLAICTNDGLGASAKNIGAILERKHYYIAPLYQDDVKLKPRSLVTDFGKLIDAIDYASDNEQIQPILTVKQ